MDKAHALDVLHARPDGLDTQLGRQFDHRVELSGGQWQKLALARALMRQRSLLLVLDEPTASLDAQTEHALFERYADAARRTSGDIGAITVLVSHRFSTVRMADLIVVIENLQRRLRKLSHADQTGAVSQYTFLAPDASLAALAGRPVVTDTIAGSAATGPFGHKATVFINDLIAGQYKVARAMFTPMVTTNVTLAARQRAWEEKTGRLGEVKPLGPLFFLGATTHLADFSTAPVDGTLGRSPGAVVGQVP